VAALGHWDMTRALFIMAFVVVGVPTLICLVWLVRRAVCNAGEYPTTIRGFRFLKQHGSSWDFAVTESFSANSAGELLIRLPEGFELCYFDPDAGQEEGWIFIRRAGSKYFMARIQRGVSRDYNQISMEAVQASFMLSPLVKQLSPEGIESFTIMNIPTHQNGWHLRGCKAD
jgi:hypothetical protein